MDRPHGLADRAVADAVRRTAAERAARAAHLARRRAGARRRALLATTLVVLAVAGWAAVVAGGLLVLGALPSALLVGVLGLGRRAVVAGHQADAAWAAGAAVRAGVPRSTRRPTAVGHARRPSEASTEVIARIAAELREPDVAPEADVVEPEPTWAPVPVPRPTYSLKPSVRRPEPAPLVLDERDGVAAAATAAEDDVAATEVVREAVDEPAASAAGFDLDAVLARRRASGE